jgi:hypothetical protein
LKEKIISLYRIIGWMVFKRRGLSEDGASSFDDGDGDTKGKKGSLGGPGISLELLEYISNGRGGSLMEEEMA